MHHSIISVGDLSSPSPRRRFRGLTLIAAGTVALTAVVGAVTVTLKRSAFAARPVPVIDMAERAPYAPQRVVYHLTSSGGFPGNLFGREHDHVVGVLANHVNAVGADRIDLKVVLQGDGIDLLRAAKSDLGLAARIDALRAKGVAFRVCRNTLTVRKLDPVTELYGVGRDDIVPAGVAEAAALAQAGYAYMKP